ncbi:MAG: hypothetical protein RQ833_11535 [Sphingomonadaceae bacterium]|nr:hypothetical protein [Sphingomonadaceae bacterium]
MAAFSEAIRAAVIVALKAAPAPDWAVWSSPPVDQDLPVVAVGQILLDERLAKGAPDGFYLVGVEHWAPADSPRALDRMGASSVARLDAQPLPSATADLSPPTLTSEAEQQILDYPKGPALVRTHTYRLLAQPKEA